MARTAPVPNIPAIPGMNPGLFVMGGGGGGGGGSGKGGKGNGANQGADGENGGEGAEGGGNGTGACGQGSNGACTNCGQNVARGDPVDVTSGKVFTIPKTDLLLRGFFNLEIRRSYSSARRQIDLGLGFGWVNSLCWSMVERRRTLIVQCGDGRQQEIPRVEVGDAQVFGDWFVSRAETFYALMPGKEFIHLFSPVKPGSKHYQLDYIIYRNRGKIALQYENGRLSRAIDTAGRVILFRPTAEGRLASIAVPDTSGRTLTFARFEYDRRGNLTSATDADGCLTHYAYDDDHQLVRLEHPNGLVFHFVYDDSGRCRETWGEYPGREDPALAEGLPEQLRDGTKAKGIYHCKLDFVDEEYTEVVDSVRLQRFEAGPGGKIGKAVGARGGVTSRTFDALGRMRTLTDPTGATWSYEYDLFGNITEQLGPEGHAIRIRRDAAGREIEIVDQAGGVTTIGRDGSGEIEWVKDQNGALERFMRSPRGLVVETMDRRDGQHKFEWDAHGNCVARQFANGARYTFAYDYWGRMIAMTGPTGAQHQLTYTPSGRLTSITDPLGRVSRLEYDAMGNPVREIQPDGTAIHWEYGGLSWLHTIRQTDGSQIRLRYNREGWPLFFENERGERHELSYEPDGALASERDFHGTVTRYGHDALGRITWLDRGEGKHELSYSPGGLVIEEVAPDGAERRFTYNERAELVSATCDDVMLTWQRDRTGNIVNEAISFSGTRYEVKSQLTPAGDRLCMSTSLGHDLAVRRDPTGRVSELWSGQQRLVSIERDARGLLVRRTLAAGGSIIDSYDAANRLRRRELRAAGEPERSAAEPDWVGRGGPGGRQWLFDYTPVNEIEKVTSPDGNDIVLEYDVRRHLVKRSEGNRTESFRADPAGNYHEVGPDAPARSYAEGNQLLARGDTRYRYDERGFLLDKSRTPAGGPPELTRYRYNSWGLLAGIDLPDGRRVDYLYDAFARRVAKSISREGEGMLERRHYVWDRLSLVHDARIDATGRAAEVRTFLFEDNDESVPLGHRDPGAEFCHYLNDVNGTPCQIVDGAGRILGQLERSAFGRTRPQSGSTASTLFRLPGQYEDPESGLHYNRYRYYDPEIGRYISPDPLGPGGGLNAYSFGPNPIGWSDPMGWYHVMSVLSAPSNFTPSYQHPYARPGAPRYRSGYTGTPCPNDLESNAGCHTEQKFCADLLAQHRDNPQAFRDSNFRLRGQLPPCPACHAAMMQAASETGANIQYEWENPHGQVNSVTYDGSSQSGHSAASPGVSVSGQHHGADLVGGYTHTPGAANPGPPQPGSTAYGYNYAGSYNTYYDVAGR